VASPDGRPWWDKPVSQLLPEAPPSLDYQTTGDYGAGSLEEEETQRVAQHAIDAAISMIEKGDPTVWAEPTPERRAFLAPLKIEKGFHDPVPGVPEVLHAPYKAFSEMYELLAKGVQPSDPEVVKRSVEVAGLITGGAVTAKLGGAAKEVAGEAGKRVAYLREAGLEGQRPPPEPEAPRPKAKNKPPTEVPRELDESGFYSHLKETVQGLEKSEAHPTEYMALLEPGRSGVKEAEIRATDLDKHLLGDHVADMRRIIIDSKEGISDLTKMMKDAEIKLSKTSNEYDRKVLANEIAQHKADIEEAKGMVKHGVAIYNDNIRELRGKPETRTRDDLTKHVEQNKTIVEEKNLTHGTGGVPPEPTPHAKYSTDPLNPTMREIELTIRNPEAEAKLNAVDKKILKVRDKIHEEVKKERASKRKPLLGEDYSREGLEPRVQKIFDEWEMLKTQRAEIQDQAYHSQGHFTQNTAAWYMASIQTGKDGRKAFVTHQVQSDWGQAARKGMQSPYEIKRLKEAVKDAENVSKKDIVNKGLFQENRNVDHPRAVGVALHVGKAAKLDSNEAYALQVSIIRSNETGRWEDGLTQILGASRDDLATPEIASSLKSKISRSDEAQRILRTVEDDHKKYYAVENANWALQQAMRAPPYHPMVASTSQWVDLAVKRIIRDAVESGADSIAIPHGKTVRSYTGGEEAGQKKFYESILPRRLEKALKEMDPDIQGEMAKDLRSHEGKILKYMEQGRTQLPSVARFTEFPLTPAVREKSKKGFRLYTKGPGPISQDEENR